MCSTNVTAKTICGPSCNFYTAFLCLYLATLRFDCFTHVATCQHLRSAARHQLTVPYHDIDSAHTADVHLLSRAYGLQRYA